MDDKEKQKEIDELSENDRLLLIGFYHAKKHYDGTTGTLDVVSEIRSLSNTANWPVIPGVPEDVKNGFVNLRYLDNKQLRDLVVIALHDYTASTWPTVSSDELLKRAKNAEQQLFEIAAKLVPEDQQAN